MPSRKRGFVAADLVFCVSLLMAAGCGKNQQVDGTEIPLAGEDVEFGELLPPTVVLDHVDFGVEESENRAAVNVDMAPIIDGGLDLPARCIQAEGKLSFTLQCAPQEHNFVTLKLWGSDVKQIVESRDGAGLRMEAQQIVVYAGDTELAERARESLGDTPLLPGRFIYRTVAIPRNLTAGREEITLTIKPAGQVGGGYASVGGPPPEDTPPESYSRGIYSAYIHTGNIFVPSEDEIQGKVPPDGVQRLAIPAPVGNKPDFDAMRANLVRAVDEGVDELRRRQLYGSKFEEAREELGIPEKLHGLFDWTGLGTFIRRGRDRGFEPGSPDWLRPVTGSASGRGHAAAGEVYMGVYRLPGSRYEGDEEMISRSIAALDGYCRYQGDRGGFEIGGGQWGWVGGSERSRATGGLPGFLAGGLARSFLALWPELEKNPELLEVMIDNNGDGRKDISRRDAYTRLFRDWLRQDYPRLALRTACANQDIRTAIAAMEVNLCLEIISPEDAFPEHIIRAALRQSAGIMPREPELVEFINNVAKKYDIGISRRGGDQHMLSPGGISMEWGFCPGYGQHFRGALSYIGSASDDEMINRQFELYISAIEHFYIPWHGQGGFRWALEGTTGSRQQRVLFGDGGWNGLEYAALQLDNSAAIRILRLALGHMGDFRSRGHGAQDRMHMTGRVAGSLGLIEKLPELAAVWEMEPLDYRLPAERPGPYAWTDPTSSAGILDPVMIKISERALLYLQNQQYHYITDTYHAYGSTHVEVDDYLASGRFGPYLVVVNRSDTPQVNETGGPRIFNPPEDLASAVDLLSGEAVDLSRPMILDARSAYVLDTRLSPVVDRQEKAMAKLADVRVEAAPSHRAVWTWNVEAPAGGLDGRDVLILPLPGGEEARQAMESYVAGGDVFEASAEDTPLAIISVNVSGRMLAVSGLEMPERANAKVQVRGELPSFSTYEDWTPESGGGHPRMHRRSIVELRNDDLLEWRMLESREDRGSEQSQVQRVSGWQSFSYGLDNPVSRIAFDYKGAGIGRFPINLRDGSGEVLWAATSEGPKRVDLSGIHAVDRIVFRVEVASDHLYGFSHRIGNLRLEYED